MKILLTDYDYQEDILFFHLSENPNYEFSENLNKDILIDFNKDKLPIGLEIFNASKVLKTKKIYLNQIEQGILKIKINEENINLNLNLTILIHQKQTDLPIEVTEDNIYNLPNVQTEVAVTSS
ncbi:MAG: DUF2283 domain-containing protein [Methanobrevibacter sp. CfCl-M3]